MKHIQFFLFFLLLSGYIQAARVTVTSHDGSVQNFNCTCSCADVQAYASANPNEFRSVSCSENQGGGSNFNAAAECNQSINDVSVIIPSISKFPPKPTPTDPGIPADVKELFLMYEVSATNVKVYRVATTSDWKAVLNGITFTGAKKPYMFFYGKLNNGILKINNQKVPVKDGTVSAKYGDILIDDVPIPFENVSGGDGGGTAGSTDNPANYDTWEDWPKDAEFGAIILSNSQYTYGSAKDIKAFLGSIDNAKPKTKNPRPPYPVGTTLITYTYIYSQTNKPVPLYAFPLKALPAGAKLATLSAYNTYTTPLTPFFPPPVYKAGRLVKCQDDNGNDFYVNCPQDHEDCCSLTALPTIDLGGGDKQMGGGGNGGSGGGIPIDTAIFIKWPPKKNGMTAAGITLATFTGNTIALKQTSIKMGQADIQAKHGDILIDGVKIEYDKISGGPGGGIPIDTAIIIHWPPKKQGSKYGSIGTLLLGTLKDGTFSIMQKGKTTNPVTMDKHGDILIDGVKIEYDKVTGGGTPKGCFCVEEDKNGNFTGRNVDCPSGNCKECCDVVARNGGVVSGGGTVLTPAISEAIKAGKKPKNDGKGGFTLNDPVGTIQETQVIPLALEVSPTILIFNDESYAIVKGYVSEAEAMANPKVLTTIRGAKLKSGVATVASLKEAKPIYFTAEVIKAAENAINNEPEGKQNCPRLGCYGINCRKCKIYKDKLKGMSVIGDEE